MTNLLSFTARVSGDRGEENGLDDVHLLVGEEIQWRISLVVFFVEKDPAAEATDAPQPYGSLCNLCDEDNQFFFTFPSNGAPVE
jgi:hypothetical protein